MSTQKVSRFGRGLIWVVLSSLAWIVVGGVLCANAGIEMTRALVLLGAGGIITGLAIIAPDRRLAERRTEAGRQHNGSGTDSQQPSGAALGQQRAFASIGLFSTRGGRQEGSMFVCIICHFEMELDDVAVDVGRGRGMCLRCYARETSTQLPMPSTLRQALHAMLEGLPTR
jgi:hypothetical protein